MNSSHNSNVQTRLFTDDGTIPNHPTWPVLLYKGAFADHPQQTEDIFNRNGWLNSWTNGVFDYHHYHSNSHEVLGVISGEVTVQLGGEQGESFTLQTGDVVVLPAGTGHKRLQASSDFRLVGAYPNGASYNTRTGEPGDHEQALREIPHVSKPDSDPVYGTDGPLMTHWQ